LEILPIFAPSKEIFSATDVLKPSKQNNIPRT